MCAHPRPSARAVTAGAPEVDLVDSPTVSIISVIAPETGLATSGPGGIHLLNGLYDAKLDGQPVLAITGLAYHDLIGTHSQQDVELDKLFVDACLFNERVMGPTHVENLVDLACRTAISYRGVAHITFPADLQEKEVESSDASKRNRAHHTSDVKARGASLPCESDLRRAANRIRRAGSRPALSRRRYDGRDCAWRHRSIPLPSPADRPGR